MRWLLGHIWDTESHIRPLANFLNGRLFVKSLSQTTPTRYKENTKILGNYYHQARFGNPRHGPLWLILMVVNFPLLPNRQKLFFNDLLISSQEKHMVGLFWGHSGQDLTLTVVVKMVCFGSGHCDVQTNVGRLSNRFLIFTACSSEELLGFTVLTKWSGHLIFGAAFALGRHEWFALWRLITTSRSSAFTGGFLKSFS